MRDQAQGVGLREWSEKDTQALCQWLDDQSKAQNPTRISHNLVETADLMGVGVHTMQGWLRRRTWSTGSWKPRTSPMEVSGAASDR